MAVKRKQDEIRRKITKSTISQIKPTDNSKWDQYLNTYSLQMFPANDQFKERLGVEMLEWARSNEEAFIIEEYFDIRGICVDDVYRWIPSCEALGKAYEAAKRIIGYRREKGALKSNLNAGTVHITMPHYSKVWRDTEKWRSELKKENEQHSNIRIVMEEYPKSPIVPDKKKNE